MTAAREDYVTSDPPLTLEAISEKHGISIQSVRQHSAKEKWVSQRELHMEKVRTLTRKKAAEQIAGIRVRQMAFGRMMQGKGAEKLHATDASAIDVEQARHLIRDGSEIERKAAGMEEKGGVLAKLMFTPEDLEKMSDEEIDALYARVRSAIG